MSVKPLKDHRTKAELLFENERLSIRLNDAEQALAAIRRGGEKGVAEARSFTAELNTEREIAESERETTIEFLRMVNESSTMRHLIDGAVGFFQQQTGCEAVGIRLQEGEDFPYFLSEGFPPEFLLTENTLCARDSDGAIIHDDLGNPVLECMCGNVICGRYDPAKPFFTANGSFWTNSTTKLLASTTVADRQARTRNRCHGEGYESVALIPLRAGEKRLGLIQLNDRRPGMFSLRNIDLWERLFGYLAVAITRFKADEEMRESQRQNEFLAGILEHSSQPFAVGYPDGSLGLSNKAFQKLTGYTGDELKSLDWDTALTPPDWREIEQAKLEELNRTGQPVSYEKEYLKKDGSRVSVELLVHFVVDTKGNPEYYYAFVTDISEHKEIEESLRQKSFELEKARVKAENDKRLLWDMMEALPIGMAITNGRGSSILTNSAFERIWGGPRPVLQSIDEYALYKAWWPDTGELVAPEEWASALALKQGEAVNGQLIRIQKFDGAEAFVLNSASPIRDANGEIVGSAVAIQDITELRRVEASLRESEALFRGVFQSAAVGIVKASADGFIQLANDAFCRMLGRTQEELIGCDVMDITHPDDIPANSEFILRIAAGEIDGYTMEKRYLRPDGSPLWANLTVTEVVDEAGHQLHNIAVVEDITVRKAAEKELLDSLREKEVLLKEVHHRVKNNLQVISSLVDLQADALDNPALAGLFQDVRDRVRSMALVHEKLYRSDNLASVNFADYVSGLLNYLWRAHNSSARHVNLKLDLRAVLLAVESAVPCGLILNELAVNALKHAFTGRDTGEVAVTLHSEADGQVCLCVKDNGTGFPSGLDWRQSRSLGLNLVQMLVKQLKAEVEVKSDGGTEFRITFKPRQAKALTG